MLLRMSRLVRSPRYFYLLSYTFLQVGLHPQFGTVSDIWKIPEGLAGGNYKIKLTYGPKKYVSFVSLVTVTFIHNLLVSFAQAEREINIREFSNPRFKMQLEFPRKGYGAGDEALANLSVCISLINTTLAAHSHSILCKM